jgi:hypothetical protein
VLNDITARTNPLVSGQVDAATLDPKTGKQAEAAGMVLTRSAVNWQGLLLFDRDGKIHPELANTAKVIAPSVVAIGGRLAQAGPLRFESVRASVEMRSLRTTGHRVEIRQAIIGTGNYRYRCCFARRYRFLR